MKEIKSEQLEKSLLWVKRELQGLNGLKDFLEKIGKQHLLWTSGFDDKAYIAGMRDMANFLMPQIVKPAKQKPLNKTALKTKYRREISPLELSHLIQIHSHKNGQPNWSIIGKTLGCDADTAKRRAEVELNFQTKKKRPKETLRK